MLGLEVAVGLGAVRLPVRGEMAPIGILVAKFAQDGQDCPGESSQRPHCYSSSARSWLSTNGVSVDRLSRVPRSSPTH
jgi:hypothetical protein